EIDNTDAEGRLVLADALTKAVESEPALIVDFATLTGAARIALGPELPALFANDDATSAVIEGSAKETEDPVWRMPLWDNYDEMLKSDIADLANSSGSSMGGAIVAAIFMKRFVPDHIPWAHLDTFAWRDGAKPGRPKGGDALGLRATFAALQQLYPRR
ncbi:MAG TPA: leucyl aminopeptidase family protein, partial [Sphingomicrobium sp.]|nr:leucyl aminopeptidase family protein [Sphingomicrobium sp.]